MSGKRLAGLEVPLTVTVHTAALTVCAVKLPTEQLEYHWDHCLCLISHEYLCQQRNS